MDGCAERRQRQSRVEAGLTCEPRLAFEADFSLKNLAL